MADSDDWTPIASAPQDGSMIEVFCAGISPPTKGVLQGCWNIRLGQWILNPYGTTQFTTLFPTMWRSIRPPPVA